MVDITTKGYSPFTPGQPVARELFTGRAAEIDKLLTRGVGQTALGKPTAFFVTGEYGIGKSSIANLVRHLAEDEHGLIGISATLGGAKTLADVAEKVLEATVRTGIYDPTRRERILDWFGTAVGKLEVSGFKIDLEWLKRESPKLASVGQLLDFLREALERVKTRRGEAKGVLLVLDEINGIASVPEFAQFLKSLIDTNALSREPLPLMLVLCGTEDKRRALITAHEPTNRLFGIVDIKPMSDAEMEAFFRSAFDKVGMAVDADAMGWLTRAAGGLPKIMHLVGDCVFWRARSGRVTADAAFAGVFDASEEVGQKFVDAQILDAIQSADYRASLDKLARRFGLFGTTFTRAELATGLSKVERDKLDKFLKRMRELNVIRQPKSRGPYEFCVRMVQIYLWLRDFQQNPVAPPRS